MTRLLDADVIGTGHGTMLARTAEQDVTYLLNPENHAVFGVVEGTGQQFIASEDEGRQVLDLYRLASRNVWLARFAQIADEARLGWEMPATGSPLVVTCGEDGGTAVAFYDTEAYRNRWGTPGIGTAYGYGVEVTIGDDQIIASHANAQGGAALVIAAFHLARHGRKSVLRDRRLLGI